MNAVEWPYAIIHSVISEDREDIGDDHVLLETLPCRSFYTKRELRSRGQGFARTLQAEGVTEGDRVVILLPNCVQFLDTLFACSYLGVVAVPLPISFSGNVLREALERISPKAYIVHSALRSQLTSALAPDAATVYEVDDDGWRGAARQGTEEPNSKGSIATLKTAAVAEQTPYCIYSSSGTTGVSKGVMLPHGALFSMARTSQQVMSFTSDDIVYTCMPLYHANAFVVMFLSAALAGARTVLAKRFSATNFWTDLRVSGATKTSLMGATPGILLKTHAGGDVEHRVKLIAAVPRPKDARDFEQTFRTTLTEFYGSTEAGLPIGVPYGTTPPEGSCGRLLPDWQAELVDPADRPVEASQTGELVVRPLVPSTVAAGYWGDPEGTVDYWRNLWIHTGDLMSKDDRGWYYYQDRLKDCIRVSGENVPSGMVEHAVVQFAGVVTVAAYGVPGEFGEQDVMVSIVVEDDTSFDLTALEEHLVQTLPKHARPRYVNLVSELPSTPTGKVRKQELRARGTGPETVDLRG